MKQLVLNIPDAEYQFVLKVVKSFPFVEIDKKKVKLLQKESILNREEFRSWNKIKGSLREAEHIGLGKLKTKTAKELLDEL